MDAMELPHFSLFSCTIITNPTLAQQHTNSELHHYAMAKYSKGWKAFRMCSTKAQPEKAGWKSWVKRLAVAAAPGVFTCTVVLACLKYEANYGRGTQYELDEMLRRVVTAPYAPGSDATPTKTYVSRQDDDCLREALREWLSINGDDGGLNDCDGGFFMVVGESGSGRTTLMQTLLQKEYKEGVLEVSLSAEDMIKRRDEDKISFIRQLHDRVWELFEDCTNLRKRWYNLRRFVIHASNIYEKAKGKDAHPLIIYINLESKKDLDYDTMMDFAGALGGFRTMLSSKTESCKIIVELSHTAISDEIKFFRPSHRNYFEVNAMTEDEFLKIGKQVLKVSKDEQKLVDEYLKYYHDWLGGHTKTLTDLATEAQPASMHTLCCLCTMLMNHPSFADVVS